MSAHRFTIFWLSFCEGNPKKSFCLLHRNHLITVKTNSKILPVTLFRELFWLSESRLWSLKNCSWGRPSMYTGENLPMRAKESKNRNSVQLSQQFFRISKRFQSKQKLYTVLIFLLNIEQGRIFKIPFAHVQKVLIGLLKKYLFGDHPFKWSFFHSPVRYVIDQYLPGNNLWNRYRSLGVEIVYYHQENLPNLVFLLSSADKYGLRINYAKQGVTKSCRLSWPTISALV